MIILIAGGHNHCEFCGACSLVTTSYIVKNFFIEFPDMGTVEIGPEIETCVDCAYLIEQSDFDSLTIRCKNLRICRIHDSEEVQKKMSQVIEGLVDSFKMMRVSS